MSEHAQVEKIPLSCSNCRKKKAKCDREQPCSSCVKSKLRCVYEKVSRTPLTRKHLTAVELELVRTKALLKRYEGTRSTPHASDLHWPSSPLDDVPTDDVHSPSTVTAHEVPNVYAVGDTNVSPAYSLETPPAGNFDWDERNLTSKTTRFNDGMASLVDRNGYMGVASGAALLKIAGDSTAEDDDNDYSHQTESRLDTPPILPALYSLAQLEPHIESYFATYHISYPIVHEPTFRAQFMEVIPRPHGRSWQVLLYIVAAIGSFAASEVTPEADLGLFEAAKKRMSIEMLETGNLTLVQALTLTSNYVQKRNQPNSGYNYMGLAKRMAWGLALHKEFPAWRNQPFQLELRRRIWWCLYIFDVGAIITFSRPLDMPADGIEVSLPLNINDHDMTSSASRVPMESESTTLYTHVRCQAQLHLATNHIYQRLISVIPSAEEMLQLDEAHVKTWLKNLPTYFNAVANQKPKYRLCHATLQWRWRNLRLLMFRPYLLRRFVKHRASVNDTITISNATSDEEKAIQICLETAHDTIKMIASFWQEQRQNVMTCWYALYFLFQAVLIPVITLRNETRSGLAPVWRDDILIALETISDMHRINPAANRCHSAIMKLCGAYLALDVSQWESPTNESPQTQMNTLYSYMFGPITDSQLFDMQGLQMQDSTFTDFMGQFGVP